MQELDTISEQIREGFEAIQAAREVTLKRSRELIRLCAKAIRTMHREEWESAEAQLVTAREAASVLIQGTQNYRNLYFAGYTQDSLKEYVEAELAFALMQGKTLPGPSELNVEQNTWLNGMAEAATELRRRILDILRHGHSPEVGRLLDSMDEIYSHLVTFDFTDSITGGLRRRTDTLRAVLERTRGDVTNSLRQTQLEEALKRAEATLKATSTQINN